MKRVGVPQRLFSEVQRHHTTQSYARSATNRYEGNYDQTSQGRRRQVRQVRLGLDQTPTNKSPPESPYKKRNNTAVEDIRSLREISEKERRDQVQANTRYRFRQMSYADLKHELESESGRNKKYKMSLALEMGSQAAKDLAKELNDKQLKNVGGEEACSNNQEFESEMTYELTDEEERELRKYDKDPSVVGTTPHVREAETPTDGTTKHYGCEELTKKILFSNNDDDDVKD